VLKPPPQMTLKTGFLSLEMGNVLNNMTMERKIGKWSLGRYFPEILRHFFKRFVSLTGGFGDWLIDLMSDIGLVDFMSKGSG